MQQVATDHAGPRNLLITEHVSMARKIARRIEAIAKRRVAELLQG